MVSSTTSRREDEVIGLFVFYLVIGIVFVAFGKPWSFHTTSLIFYFSISRSNR